MKVIANDNADYIIQDIEDMADFIHNKIVSREDFDRINDEILYLQHAVASMQIVDQELIDVEEEAAKMDEILAILEEWDAMFLEVNRIADTHASEVQTFKNSMKGV